MVQLSHPYMTTGKTIALTKRTFVSKVMSLLFNTLSKFVMAFLPMGKCLLISWLQFLSAVILKLKKIKSHCFHFLPPICREVMGQDAMILVFECWVSSQLSHPPLSPPSRSSLVLLFSSLLSAIRMLSSAYLRLMFFLIILIPACNSSSPAAHMMYSAQKLNKQGDNMQPCHTLLSILNKSVAPCKALTVASRPAYSFPRRQVRWSDTIISLRIFHSLLWSTQLKALA